MNNWVGVSYWVLMAAMLRLSYELSEAGQHSSGEDQGNYKPLVDGSNPFAGESDEMGERMKRFAALPPATQERILAYGEKMLEYLHD